MATLNSLAYTELATATADEREQLILEHLPQVRWIASRMHERLPNSTSLDDLISIGIIGLINAIDNFKPEFNAKLKTYAEHKIRGAILDSIRGMDGIPTHKRKRLKEIQVVVGTLEQRFQRAPGEEEIAAELGIPLDTYQEWLLELRGVSVGSLDTASSNREDAPTLMHYIADKEENSPACVLERAELQELIATAITRMPRMEGMVLDLYYRQELGIREIATILDIHITRVSQIKSQAVIRLRTFIEKRWPAHRGAF
jgi:RNA polymerase sigma factor for flagellar operon FliA